VLSTHRDRAPTATSALAAEAALPNRALAWTVARQEGPTGAGYLPGPGHERPRGGGWVARASTSRPRVARETYASRLEGPSGVGLRVA